jgi:hypothetical protein
LNQQLLNRTIRYEDARIEQAQINQALLSWVDDLPTYPLASLPHVPPLKAPGLQFFLKRYAWLILSSILLAVVGAMAFLPANQVEVDIELQTYGVGFETTEDWNKREPIGASEIYLNELQAATLPGIAEIKESFDFTLAGENLELSQIAIPTGNHIDLEINEQGFHFYSRGESLNGVFQIGKGKIYTANEEWENAVDNGPMLITFSTPANKNMIEPIRLSCYQADNVKWLNFRAKSLNFMAESDDGTFLSRIVYGTVFPKGKDNSIDLHENDNLNLEIISCRELSIEQSENLLQMRFRGEVSSLYAGPKGFEENYMPTLLESLFEKQKPFIIALLIVTFLLLMLGIYRIQKGNKALMLYILLGLSTSLAPSLNAQNCDATLHPIADENLSYQERGNRCEGLYKSDVSSGSLKLVGLMQDKLRFRAGTDSVVKLKLQKDPMYGLPIFVRAQAIPNKTYYQMDASLNPGETLDWHLEDVVHPKGILSRKLSVYAYFKHKEKYFYVPVVATSSSGAAYSNSKVTATFRASVDISVVIYKWYGKQNQVILEGKIAENQSETIRSGSPIFIPTPVSGKGMLGLHVLALEKQYSTQASEKEPEWIEKILFIYL